MDLELLRSEIVERGKNFYWDQKRFKKQVAESESYILNFSILKDHILCFSTMGPRKELSKDELFIEVAHEIYFAYKASENDLILFGNELSYSGDAYQAYFFSMLCAFLHASRRIKRKTLRDFVYGNNPQKFKDPDSPNYYHHTLLENEVEKLRKLRNRLLSRGELYIKNLQWSAISKGSEHEWTFYYALEDADERVQDTFKRLGNLYNDINKALNLSQDNNYKNRLKAAYKKFSSKIQKLKYKNYIELIKVILSHVNKDRRYYGLNLYRLEQRLQPYKIICEVNSLLACPSDFEDSFLWMTVILGNTSFPKLYKDFSSLPYCEAELYADEFPRFLQEIVISSCLIIDELIEKGAFGDDWENLFRNTLNEMAEDVLYDPSQLNFTISEGAQEKFEKLLAPPVFSALCAAAETNFEHFIQHELPF